MRTKLNKRESKSSVKLRMQNKLRFREKLQRLRERDMLMSCLDRRENTMSRLEDKLRNNNGNNRKSKDKCKNKQLQQQLPKQL